MKGQKRLLSKAAYKRLATLQQQCQAIRAEYCISPPGAVLFFAQPNILSQSETRVIADGFGGATLVLTEGIFGFDHVTHEEIHYPSEDAACQAAEVTLISG